ncbi:gamma-carotene 1'-hydroxylase CruF [Leptolyngbya sp. AN02str]|uniref:gamma-carotene 1'-hydroxylase CruF n=1 Tax=Leptolyngbya sp. AN02str TaxID=3423363 RepID=UPI003D31FCE5
MSRLAKIEQACVIGHLVAMAFGLAGLLLVMPHPEFLAHVPGGQTMFAWSMAGGGVVYILFGAIAVAMYAYRTLGLAGLISFAVAAIAISLTSELLGTSTGFPFGNYSYLSGLGYKIAGLVPFTIPLSWFYLGLCSFVLAREGLRRGGQALTLGQNLGAIALGAVLLTSWDFVLDPAMSQTAMPFWYWHEPGAFFGMPYQNFAGWFGTGVVFMAIAAGFWRRRVPVVRGSQLNLPIVVYLGNIVFATVMSLGAGFWVPVLLGMVTGVFPAVVCWWAAQTPVAPPQISSETVLEAPLPTSASM